MLLTVLLIFCSTSLLVVGLGMFFVRQQSRSVDRLLTARVSAVLAASGKESERVRALPAEVMTYYVIALGLLLLGVWFYRGRRVHAMISASRDGERIAQVTQHLGFVPIRGSTSKGSLGATRRLVAVLRAGERTVITPDGPRGPRRRAQPGLVAAARLSGRPIVAIASNASTADPVSPRVPVWQQPPPDESSAPYAPSSYGPPSGPIPGPSSSGPSITGASITAASAGGRACAKAGR